MCGKAQKGEEKGMNVWSSFLIAFSMYSRLPVPRTDWTKEHMRYVMCFFPLVGTVLGALFLGVWKLCGLLGLGTALTAVLLTLLPVAVTGGIHMDGLMDTMDALSSWQPMEKKLEILKDSRAGAFAVLSCGCYLLLAFGVYAEIVEKNRGMFQNFADSRALFVLAFGFTVSRALSGLSVLTFPCAKNSGLAASFSDAAVKRAGVGAMAAYLVCCLAGMLLLDVPCALCMFVAAGISFFYYKKMSQKEFGGITGDLAGFFLQICELAMTVGWLLGSRL